MQQESLCESMRLTFKTIAHHRKALDQHLDITAHTAHGLTDNRFRVFGQERSKTEGT